MFQSPSLFGACMHNEINPYIIHIVILHTYEYRHSVFEESNILAHILIEVPLLQIRTSSHRFDRPSLNKCMQTCLCPRLNKSKLVFAVKMTLEVGMA